MSQPTKVAVLGTYRSGSSLVAAMLDQLGVDMGAPYHGDYFEAADLAVSLRRWWNEPELTTRETASNRVFLLRQWLESRGSKLWVGCKHPLLSLSASDLLRAWGADTKFIWSNRRLEDSIASLESLRWWPNSRSIQEKLFSAVESFFPRKNGLIVNFEDTVTNPQFTVERLVEFLQLTPTAEQIQSACNLVRDVKKHPVGRASLEAASDSPQSSEARTHRIVATMLCGNNEATVENAARSVIDWVDNLLFIDTGSTDGSLEIVQSIAGPKLVVRNLDWRNDFAWARNKALEFAGELGAKWVLTIDTDERLDFGAIHSRDQLLAVLESAADAQAWMVDAQSGSYEKERVIRLPTQLRWQGRTHEALCGARVGRRPKLAGVRFSEARKSPEEFQFKLSRDLKILREELKENPAAGRTWYYLGQTLYGLKQFEGAIAAFDRCSAIRAWDELAAWACYRAAKCLADAHRFEEAIERCAIGLAIDPKYPELSWMSGWCCLQLGEWKRAVAWAQMSVAIGATANKDGIRERIGFRDLLGWYEGLLEVLCAAFEQLGEAQLLEAAKAQLVEAQAMRLRDFAK